MSFTIMFNSVCSDHVINNFVMSVTYHYVIMSTWL